MHICYILDDAYLKCINLTCQILFKKECQKFIYGALEVLGQFFEHYSIMLDPHNNSNFSHEKYLIFYYTISKLKLIVSPIK